MVNYQNKQVLVTGGAGVIGRELINMLVEAGAIVRCIDLVERPDELRHVDYYRLDLSSNETQLLFRFNPEIVFHLAADFERSSESEEFWESNYHNNIQASHNMIRSLLTRSSVKKVVFASSYLVYDCNLYGSLGEPCALSESSQINPRNLTGLSKLQTEMDLTFFQDRFESASARIFRVYGCGSRDIISRWIRAVLRSEEILLYGADNRFDFIYAADAAKGLMHMGQMGVQGVFNLGRNLAIPVREVVDELSSQLGQLAIKVVEDISFPESSMADMAKFKQEMNWKPEVSLKEGITKIIQYEKAKCHSH